MLIPPWIRGGSFSGGSAQLLYLMLTVLGDTETTVYTEPLTQRNKILAVLCAARKSIYKKFNNIEVYDEQRNARSFRGGLPVITHAPCRSYSAFLSHQANPTRGERDLALFCIEQVIINGGVFEHPAHSRVFNIYDLPKPGECYGGLKTIAVEQRWWGYPMTKRTWLLTLEDAIIPEFPFQLLQHCKQSRIWANMTVFQRHETIEPFAKFLMEIALSCKKDVKPAVPANHLVARQWRPTSLTCPPSVRCAEASGSDDLR